MFEINFEYPLLFLLTLPIILCLVFCKVKNLAIYFPQSNVLRDIIKQKQLLLNILKFIILLLIITTIASPIKTDNIIIDNSQGYEISLILDASGSMENFNKFTIVKNIVTDFIDKRKTDKLALSIFADFAYIAVPLTYDKNSIKRLLNKIEVGIAGKQKTALYEALFLSSNLYKNSKSKEKIAVLLTDGVDTANNVPLSVAINTAKKYNIKVYTVGIGRIGEFNPQILQQIAKQTGGKYFNSSNVAGIKEIYATINKLEKSKIQIDKHIKKTYYFQYPLILALILLIIYFWQRNR